MKAQRLPFWKRQLPNMITWGRIAFIPPVVFCLMYDTQRAGSWAAFFFIGASVSDFFDGYFARRYNLISRFGKMLDPVADKLLVSTTLVLLVGVGNIPYITFPAIVIVGREIVVSALREWMAEMGQRVSVAVSYMGKVKTFMQMVAIYLLIAHVPSSFGWGEMLGIFLLYIAAGLTLWSMVIYLAIAWPSFFPANEAAVRAGSDMRRHQA